MEICGGDGRPDMQLYVRMSFVMPVCLKEIKRHPIEIFLRPCDFDLWPFCLKMTTTTTTTTTMMMMSVCSEWSWWVNMVDSGTVRRLTALLKSVLRYRRLVTTSTGGLVTCSDRLLSYCSWSSNNGDSSAWPGVHCRWPARRRSWLKMLRNEKGRLRAVPIMQSRCNCRCARSDIRQNGRSLCQIGLWCNLVCAQSVFLYLCFLGATYYYYYYYFSAQGISDTEGEEKVG